MRVCKHGVKSARELKGKDTMFVQVVQDKLMLEPSSPLSS